MLYLYDEALANDLAKCIDPSGGMNPNVKVIGADGIVPIMAQLQEDKIQFPLICIFRNDAPIDTRRTNFTAMKFGVATVVDPDTHMIYNEKVIPVNLSYDLTILATNTVDMDEIVKELIFHYNQVYFVTIKNLPYESNRSLRFGVRVNEESIKRTSGAVENMQAGTLYQTQMTLECDGAVLLSYTPRHLMRMGDTEVIAEDNNLT